MKIATLTNKWEELVFKNKEIDVAILELEAEIGQLNAQSANGDGEASPKESI